MHLHPVPLLVVLVLGLVGKARESLFRSGWLGYRYRCGYPF